MEITEPSIFEELEQERVYNYASTGQRFLHFIIDTVILCNVYAALAGAAISIVMLMMGIDPMSTAMFDDSATSKVLSYLVGALCIVLSYTFIEGATKGRTLGKLITGTEVLREDGTTITFKDAWMRAWCRVVPLETFSGLSGYPWHDKWTKTIVVKKRK